MHPLAYNLHSSASHSNVKVTQTHDTFCLCALSLRCLSRLDMRTRAAHTVLRPYHGPHRTRTPPHSAVVRLWRLSATYMLPALANLYVSRPRPHLHNVSRPRRSSTRPRIRAWRRRCAATPHEREVVGRWVAPVARSARYGARASGVFRRAGCCSRPAAARRARRGVWPPCPACSRDPSMRSSARSPPRSRRSPPRSPRRRPPQIRPP